MKYKWELSYFRRCYFDEDKLVCVQRTDDIYLLLEYYSLSCTEDLRNVISKKIYLLCNFVDFLRNEPDSHYRQIGVNLLQFPSDLVEFAKNDSDSEVRRRAMNNIDVYAKLYDSFRFSLSDYESDFIEIAKNDYDEWNRKLALKFIFDESTFIEIAKSDPDFSVRLEAIGHIYDEKALTEIAKKDSDKYIRNIAMDKVNDFHAKNEMSIIYENKDKQEIKHLAKHGSTTEVRLLAIDKIEESNDLVEIYNNGRNDKIRQKLLSKMLWLPYHKKTQEINDILKRNNKI